MPTASRAEFIIVNIARIPLCGSPKRCPVASSKLITQVAEARRPILCSIEPQRTPLRAPEAAVRRGQELGRDEQADALDALRPAGDSRQHQVNDVLGQVVFAAGDEYLGAGDAIAAVFVWLGGGCG